MTPIEPSSSEWNALPRLEVPNPLPLPAPTSMSRRTPRRSMIVVLPDNHAVSPDDIAAILPSIDGEIVDVIVACAGQPGSLTPLQRRVHDLQVLLAPAGTSSEDLRELAMRQAAGDVVVLRSGTPSEYPRT